MSRASGSRGWRLSSVVSTHAPGLLALVFYALGSVLLFGRGVLASPSETVVGDAGSDKTIVMWALEWWPYDIRHGGDPFSADVVWAPEGMDLAWVTAVPGAAFLAAPLTHLAGPVATYNTLALLAPAMAAWTAFLLARWITDAFGPALVAGVVFGFSSFEVGHTIGHLNLTTTFAIPLCTLFVLRRYVGELARTRFLVYLTLTLSIQFLLSTELFLTLVGFGLGAAALAWWLLERDDRVALRTTTIESVCAVGLTTLVVSPYLIHAFLLTGLSWAPTRDPIAASADLANFIVPRRWTWLRPPWSDEIAARFTANPVESTAYLGLPLVAIIVLFALRRGRPWTHRLLLMLLALTAFVSLGAWIRLAGTTIAVGVGQILSRAPVTKNALPVRLSLFVALCAALVCALWLAEQRRSPLRWLLALTAVVALLPAPAQSFWTSDVQRSEFFTNGHAAERFAEDDTVLVLPYGKSGWSMLWQAETGFAYRIAGGRLGNLPPSEQRWRPVLQALAGAQTTPEATGQLPAFLREHGVDAIVVVPSQTRNRVERLVATLGVEPAHIADALVYQLSTRKR